jgi:hypothetical protein
MIALCYPALSWAFYDIPSNRRITWDTGLDPVGGIPSGGWTVTTPSGLHPDGSQNDAGIINNAIAAASPHTVIYLPAGLTHSSNITMKSNVVLRGLELVSLVTQSFGWKYCTRYIRWSWID